MQTYLPCLAGLVLVALPGALGQSVDPLSNLVSQALEIATDVVSRLQATATSASTTSTSPSSSLTSPSSSSTSSRPSSTSSSSVTSTTTPTRITTSTRSASNTAGAAATSSSAAAAVATADARNGKNRTTAIALGVVLGLLALATVIGLLLCCLRRRRRQRAVGSRRSVSPEAVGGASWGKEPLGNSNAVEHIPPNRMSTNERHHTPVGAGAPTMTENALHTRNGNGALGNSRPIPHRVAPNFQPGVMDGAPAGQGLHHSRQGHIPLSSHSRSGAAAAGLGGAALGGLAAKHHHDNHHQRDFAHHSKDHSGISRKPVGAFGRGKIGQPPNPGVTNNAAPGYQAGQPVSSQGVTANSFQPIRTTDSTSPNSSSKSGSPPAYDGTADRRSSHPLSSHPPIEDSHRHSTGHAPHMTGAAGVGAGALAGAALARHHDGDRNPDSSLTGRRSWDANRQPQHPQSILANPANRRSVGSTNPYVQARSPKQARFSDEVLASNTRANEAIGHQDTLPQDNPHPKMEPSRSNPQLASANTWEHGRNQSPSHMPGGWRGSGEFDRPGHRASFSSDKNNNNNTAITTASPQSADPKPKNPSPSDLRQQEEGGWYRGRYMGDDVRPVDSPSSTSGGYDDRFYAANRRSVGQAM